MSFGDARSSERRTQKINKGDVEDMEDAASLFIRDDKDFGGVTIDPSHYDKLNELGRKSLHQLQQRVHGDDVDGHVLQASTRTSRKGCTISGVIGTDYLAPTYVLWNQPGWVYTHDNRLLTYSASLNDGE